MPSEASVEGGTISDTAADPLNIAGKFGAAAAAKVKQPVAAPSQSHDSREDKTKKTKDSSEPTKDPSKKKSKRKHTDDTETESKRKRSTHDKQPPPPSQPSGEMIIVTVNDRLGTKAQIPCSPSDKIGDFKKLVAMKIGRKPHEIMVKRQGERPFKDILTLEDYGVGNGVQLDLELDTGD